MPARNIIRFENLPKNRPFSIDLKVEPEDLTYLADALDALSVQKLRFTGELVPLGKRGWSFSGTLGATVIQECVITSAPVTTRIDEKILRKFSPDAFADFDAGSENEMPEDDSVDPIPEEFNILDILTEALSLSLPDYPRAKGAKLQKHVFSQQGVAPLTDESVKPFAGLAALRDQLEQKT